jgi:4-amino-4-deoxy-L-arabinose transferase
VTIRRRDRLLPILLALVLGLGFQGSRGLYETTEGRYAEAGREMLETGDWWVPTLDYRPHWTKPPLTYWTIAAGIAAAGPDELGARLANGLALPLVVLAVAWLGTLLWDPRAGLLAGLVYATSVFPVVAASTISTDLVLTLWEVLSAALYWRAVRAAGFGRAADGPAPESREGPWVLAFWCVTGLAFLTKGPPGLLTLAAVLVHHGVALRKGWPAPRLARPLAIVAFLIVGLGWYLDVVLRTPGLLSYFIGDEVVARVATDRFGRNPEWYKPPLVYGLPLALGLGGWLVHLGRVRRGLRPPGAAGGPLRRRMGRPVPLFLALWLLLPLAVLTVSRSRLPLYVLPFFAVLPLVVARGLSRTASGPGILDRGVARTAAVMTVLLLAIKAGSALVPSSRDISMLNEALDGVAPADSVRVVAVNRDGLYGLEFYRRGALDRVRTDVPDDASNSMRGYLDALAPGAEQGVGPLRRIFVARGGDEAEERVLRSTPWIRVRPVPVGEGWRVWLVEPAPALLAAPAPSGSDDGAVSPEAPGGRKAVDRGPFKRGGGGPTPQL